MREAKKEQIQQIVALLKKVLTMLAEKCHMENQHMEFAEEILGILQECQEVAIEIGTSIEKEEGASHAAIPILENFCEMLYQFSVSMSKEKLEEIKSILDDLEKIMDDMVTKKVVCFLPYKASMWDSLESVWKAADEDAECDAYVIPIPYFDRKANGTLGEMHYEGDLYPAYVPITSYEEFDFEEVRPDKIFIHNPYDEFNRVTSVHPAFYSSKLKNYTEELVYIPYFVLAEIEPEDGVAIEHMAHFCKVPAVLNAHKVIVQSEKMKQVYVKVLTEWMGEDTRTDWEKKILGLGSPKLDKVGNIPKEDIDIPKEWMKIIQKADGSWKKIIFYNTSISAFLEHSEQMLEKIANVFHVFEEYKDEIALLWRPHPLMISMMESMRPELLEKYHRLIERYKENQIGIYDDTPDLDRAICLADAYYGDPSSVVQLCKKVGMPVMIQNVDVDYD